MNTREQYKEHYIAEVGPYSLSTSGHIVYWMEDRAGKEYCISIAIFERGEEGYNLRFVGSRPFEYSWSDEISFMDFAEACQKYMNGKFALEELTNGMG